MIPLELWACACVEDGRKVAADVKVRANEFQSENHCIDTGERKVAVEAT